MHSIDRRLACGAAISGNERLEPITFIASVRAQFRWIFSGQYAYVIMMEEVYVSLIVDGRGLKSSRLPPASTDVVALVP